MSKFFIFIVITVLLNATSQLLMKAGVTQVGKATLDGQALFRIVFGYFTNPYIMLGLVTMTISMVTHMIALSRFEVSFVVPFLSFTYIIIAVAGFLFMGEPFNLMRYIGIGVIILGTIILVWSH